MISTHGGGCVRHADALDRSRVVSWHGLPFDYRYAFDAVSFSGHCCAAAQNASQGCPFADFLYHIDGSLGITKLGKTGFHRHTNGCAYFNRVQPVIIIQSIDLAPELFVNDLDRLNTRLSAGAPEAKLSLIGRRHLRSNNSWMHNTARLMKGKERCTLMIHPEDASRIGVKSGDLVTVSSRVGRVSAPADVTDDMMPGVVSLPHGFGHGLDGVRLRVATDRPGVSVNDLTDELALDLSGNAALSGVPVTVVAAEQVAAAE